MVVRDRPAAETSPRSEVERRADQVVRRNVRTIAGFLTLGVSLEAIFLSAFIMITQNRQARLADRRNHLDLQINLLAEQEVTKLLEMVEGFHHHLGIGRSDPDVAALKEATQAEKVVEHVQSYVEGHRKIADSRA